jgi:hypothetical protein
MDNLPQNIENTSLKKSKLFTFFKQDYSIQFSRFQEYYSRYSVIYSLIAERIIISNFIEMLSQLRGLEEYYYSKKNPSREDIMNFTSSFINIADFSDNQKKLIESAELIANSIIKCYDETIDGIFNRKNFEKIGNRYRLTVDVRASQNANIIAIVMSHFSTIIAESKDIVQRRIWLKNNLQQFINASTSGFDVSFLARLFSNVVLLGDSPLIAIPNIIISFKHGYDNNKRSNDQIEQYANFFSEFENKINSFWAELYKATEKTKLYVKDKFSEINGKAITSLLSEISATGRNINFFFNSLDFKDLEEVERKFTKEGN